MEKGVSVNSAKFGQKAKQFRYEVVRVERQGHISDYK